MRCVALGTGAPLAGVEIEWRTGASSEPHESRARTDELGVLHLKMPEQNVELRCAGDLGAWTTIAWSAGASASTVALRPAP